MTQFNKKKKLFMTIGISSSIALAAIAPKVIDVFASVTNSGRDIRETDAHASDNSGVAMTYTRFDTGSSKQTASGSGVFIAPNVMVTVAHNYLDKNRETGAGFVRGGDSAQSHVVMNSNSEKRNGVPADGVDQLVEKGDIHYYNQNELGKSYTNDLSIVVLSKPVEAMTHGEDSYRTIGTAKQGDGIRLVGYPNDFSSKNLSSDARNTLKDGKLYEVRGTISELSSNGEGKYHMSASGGFSGGPVFNNAGQLVGIHQHGTNSDVIPEDQQYGAGLFFTEAHKAWLKEMVDKYAIKGWYVDGNDKYYYDDNHQPVKNEERTIDGARYRFDAQGRGTLISGKETGRVVLRAVDKQGNLLFERVVGTGQVGSGFTYDFKSDKNNQAYFADNPNATVVSIDTESIGKKFNEQWDKDFASKYQLGNTMIKVVIDGGREFSRTVDNSGSSVKPLVADDKVKAVPNGEKNFNATVALTTEAGLGSGTLINEDTIVTVAHNFVHLNTKTNPISVVNNVNKSGDVHIATLPNGRQVRFSNDDVKFWNREGFVNGFKNDLAVIKLRHKFTGETPATLHDTVQDLASGDTIHVFGFPKGKLNPILNGKVENVENYGANIRGVAYQGSAPGMSGGGLYNAQGELIGVHQNGVEGKRAGGIAFSKEQLDWVNAIARGENAQPVYLKDEPREDDKDKESKYGKLIETDDQSRIGWIGELYEDGTYVMKGVPGKNVELNNTNAKLNTMFAGEIGLFDKLSKIKKVIVDGKLVADRFDVASIFDLNEMDLTGLSLTDKAETPLLIYKSKNLTKLKLDKNFKLNSDSSLLRMIDGAPNLKLTNEQVTQLLSDLALTVKQYDGPLIRNVGVERLDLSTFDNSKIDPTTYSEYSSHALDGNAFTTKSVFKDLIGLKEVVFGDKFDFTKYGSKSTKNAFLDTDLSGVERVTFAGSKRGNNKFIDDWLTDVKKLNDKNKQGLYHDGKYVSSIDDALGIASADDTAYFIGDIDPGVYTLGPIEIKISKPTIEFKKDRVRINDSYELDKDPYLIVKETSDMKVDNDPGLIAALEAVKGDSDVNKEKRKKIEDLMSRKTGRVFKVRSYEKNGQESWRYFRTWTNDVNALISHAMTIIPYRSYEEDKQSKNDVITYEGDSDLEFGKAQGIRAGLDVSFNIAAVTWLGYQKNEIDNSKPASEPDFELSNGDTPSIYEKYSGDNLKMYYELVKIGLKTELKTEVIEKAGIKYRKNSDLDTDTKLIQRGNDKIKKTITKYTLKKDSSDRHEVEPLLSEEQFDIPKDSKVLPTLENGGFEATTSEEVTELKDTIIEKRVPKDTQKEEAIAPKVIYQKDDTREKGQQNIQIDGVAGKKVTPIKYDVNPDTGEVIQVPGEPITTPAKNTIIQVAAKDKVRYVINGEDVVKETIEYSVNPDTGEVTNKVTREISNAGGAKKLFDTKKTPSPKKYVKDDTREKDQPNIIEKGQDGEVIYEFPMIVNESTGAVTKGKPVLVKDTKPTDTIVKVAAKDKVVTEEIESPKRYIGDEEQDYGSEAKETPGQKGSLTTTTIYTVNSETGNVTEDSTTVVKDPTETIIKVGTKSAVVKTKDDKGRTVITTTTYTVDSKTGKVTPTVTVTYENNKDSKVVTETIPSTRRYEKDSEREKGSENIVIEGKDGKKVTTTTYKVNEQTGEITETVSESVVTEPTETIVKIAAKDKIVTEEIQPSIAYERDDSRNFGTPNVESKGEVGKKVTTIEYSVNEKTGEVTENVKDSVVTPASATHIKVGTKTHVETIRNGGNVIERLTKYELDPKTGTVTEKMTEKLVSSNGDAPAPILDILEYTRALTSNGIDETGHVIQPPVLDVPEFKGLLSSNGIDNSGNIIQPPALDIPEFKGSIAPNDAPKVNIPEYKGKIKKPEEPQQTTAIQEIRKPEKPQQTTVAQKEEVKPRLPKTSVESMFGLTATGLIATIGAAFAKLRKKK